MRSKIISRLPYLIVLVLMVTASATAQNRTEYLTKDEIKKDLEILDRILREKSSYQGLNGFSYREDFEAFVAYPENKEITQYDFGLFLSQTIGKIGDRHAYIDGYESRDSLFFPLAFAPYRQEVLVLAFDSSENTYGFWDPEFPYLKSIDSIPVEKILPQVLPGEALAPKSSYRTRAIRELRDIDKVFALLKKDLPNPLPITLSNDTGEDKTVWINLVLRSKRPKIWDERFHIAHFFLTEEQSNNPEIIKQFLTLEDDIAHIRIVDMLDKADSPVYFEFLNDFMSKAKPSKALVIDVRDNGGGTRDLIQELAGYIIHPDSVYVVNGTKQRAKLPLGDEMEEELNYRFLFSAQDLDVREQQAIAKFMDSFQPMYKPDTERFSEYFYYVLNGRKLTKGKYHFNKPIYILCNERTFSAASILVSVFKGLPNIQIVGVNTDGSSGNSERFELPNSGLRGKISTMVSYQKNGLILDGIGTSPNILIERNLDQILLIKDYQLKRLKEIIETQ